MSTRFREWWRRPSRIQVAQRRRRARRAEARVVRYPFPVHLAARVRAELPEIGEQDWDLVEQGLREWLVCCAWHGSRILGMPSRAVDEAWHTFILDTRTYARFCESAFGEYLHHTPDEAMTSSMPEALAETVRAWDRSELGSEGESVLWDLDRRLGIERPYAGLGSLELGAARTRSPYPLATGWIGTSTTAAYAAGYSGLGYYGGAGGGGEGGGGGGGGCGGGGGGGGCGGGGS